MRRSAKFLVHILLNTGRATPEGREALVATVTHNAPESALYQSEPTVQNAVVDLAPLGADYTAARAAVGAARANLALQEELLSTATAALDRGLILLKGIVENKATTPDQAAAVGFTVRGRPSRSDLLVAPDGVRVMGSRTRGRFTVTAHDLKGREHFAAQICADPIAASTWVDLPGNGKRRKLTGYPSGAVVWVRIAALRGQDRGAWGTPVSVVVP